MYDLLIRAYRNDDNDHVLAEVKAAYDAATDEAYAQMVNVGIHQAYQRDLDAAAAREAEKELRRKAAAVVGVTVTEPMLVQDRENFVFNLWDLTPKQFTEVREAALVAYRGTPEQRQEFLTTGIVAAKKAADERIAREAKEKEEAEKEAQRVREARTKALAVVNLEPAEGLVSPLFPEGSFVIKIAQAAPANSWVQSDAYLAIMTERESPGALRHFIFTGIHEAHAKDLAGTR
ncbi:hypothetical protein M8C13_43755 [Crossiella sp. SN42]|uniref:hypothetical protein n=1 Tax=Crossiella sp. SN42 TaxID=2944808 RepID=UPI00207D1277|nr:hypothetical protein [Crossiella sp. SN42]MCO1582683.1 hypothetical protein [Crossiella sp. SN42]